MIKSYVHLFFGTLQCVILYFMFSGYFVYFRTGHLAGELNHEILGHLVFIRQEAIPWPRTGDKGVPIYYIYTDGKSEYAFESKIDIEKRYRVVRKQNPQTDQWLFSASSFSFPVLLVMRIVAYLILLAITATLVYGLALKRQAAHVAPVVPPDTPSASSSSR